MIENTNYYWNLIKRSQDGQRNSFVELAGFYQKDVYLYALKLTGNIAYAEKITNDVFIKAWEHIKYLNENSPFHLWLNGLTVSITTSSFQSKNKIESSGKELILSNENDKIFINLTPKVRLLLILHDLEGYSVSDCAVMINEKKTSDLFKDLAKTRKLFIDQKTISILESYTEEAWRKLTQDFEYWIADIQSDDQLPEDLLALKNYRKLLNNFIAENKPSELLLVGLKEKLYDESKIQEEKKKKELENKRKLNLAAGHELDLNEEEKKIFANTADKNELLTDEAAKIFSNPEDSKDKFSIRLNLVNKQKHFVKNLSYVLIAMNAVVIFFIVGNLVQNVTWKADSYSQITGENGTFKNTEIGVGDILKTKINEKLKIDIQSVGDISLHSNTAVEILNCELDNNQLKLVSGEISLNTDIYYNRFSVKVADAVIHDYGSSSTISYLPELNKKRINVNRGGVKVQIDKQIIPVPEDYIYIFGDITSFNKHCSAKYIKHLRKLKIPISISHDLGNVLSYSTKKDAITLWVLLNNADMVARNMIYKKITSYFKLPANTTESGLLSRNPKMMQLLLDDMEWQL